METKVHPTWLPSHDKAQMRKSYKGQHQTCGHCYLNKVESVFQEPRLLRVFLQSRTQRGTGRLFCGACDYVYIYTFSRTRTSKGEPAANTHLEHVLPPGLISGSLGGGPWLPDNCSVLKTEVITFLSTVPSIHLSRCHLPMPRKRLAVSS